MAETFAGGSPESAPQTRSGPPAPLMSHTDGKYSDKSTSENCLDSWRKIKANRPANVRPVTQEQIDDLSRKASEKGINEEFVRRAMNTFKANQEHLPNQRYVTFIDFHKKSNEQRMVMMDLQNNSFETFHVSAGEGSDVNKDGYATRFTNDHNTNSSSLGCYVANGRFTERVKKGKARKNSGRPSLLIHGIESSNDNACQRGVYMHSAWYVGGVPGASHGCPAVRPQDHQKIFSRLDGGGLICSYYDGPDKEPARRARKGKSNGRRSRR